MASATAMRTHRCGELGRDQVGETVRLGGWVHRRRDLGGLVFIDLRDRAGLVQLSFDPAWTLARGAWRAPAAAGAEIGGAGGGHGGAAARSRPGTPTLATRDVEVHVTELRVVGPAATPAIPVARKEGEELPAEELRLKHRVLDLRRPELQANLMLRHRLLQRARRTLSDLGFLEIETPILTKPTPEGARDYLVPSRVHPGEFYALPQSPQIYKQLLMVAGYDRYFQIARCFRDEDLRADRQPEFTQIDLEASFVSQEDVHGLRRAGAGGAVGRGGRGGARAVPADVVARGDGAVRHRQARPALRPRDPGPARRWSQPDAAPFVHEALAKGGRLRGIVAPGAGSARRKELDELTAAAKDAGRRRPDLGQAQRDGAWEGQGVKALGAETLAKHRRRRGRPAARGAGRGSA